MSFEKKIFADNPAVAAAFATDFVAWLETQTQAKVTVSLSGGSTPTLLFEVLARDYADKVDWSRVHLYWGDERCVPPEDAESNFGVCKSLLLDKVPIPAANVHRVIGESDPAAEAIRYGEEMKQHCELNSDGTPDVGSADPWDGRRWPYGIDFPSRNGAVEIGCDLRCRDSSGVGAKTSVNDRAGSLCRQED